MMVYKNHNQIEIFACYCLLVTNNECFESKQAVLFSGVITRYNYMHCIFGEQSKPT